MSSKPQNRDQTSVVADVSPLTMSASSSGVPSWGKSLGLATAAVACFHLAYAFHQCAFAVVGFLFCLFELRNVNSRRKAFYFGLAIGLSVYAPQLRFFWVIFHGAAIALWLVLAFWIGLFLLTLHLCARRMSRPVLIIVAPLLWTGFEYFRSELYYLRFSWLNIGYAFSFTNVPFVFGWVGVYGIGFALMLSVCVTALCKSFRTAAAFVAIFTVLVAACLDSIPIATHRFHETDSPLVSGVQLEFPGDKEVLRELDKLLAKHPRTDIVVLSEYTFLEPPPDAVRQWCKANRKFVIVGGKDPVSDAEFRNTAFVIGPDGDVVFKQVKSVPIQFFKDGLAATEQNLWSSPWGKIGICICYDLSYRRVIDSFVRKGAQALIVPTMDVADWGAAQHQLHARIAPFRAAEYGIPIFRLCSSGISQVVNGQGIVQQSAPFPGEGATISSGFRLAAPGRLPLDAWLAPACVAATAAIWVWLIVSSFCRKTAIHQ